MRPGHTRLNKEKEKLVPMKSWVSQGPKGRRKGKGKEPRREGGNGGLNASGESETL